MLKSFVLFFTSFLSIHLHVLSFQNHKSLSQPVYKDTAFPQAYSIKYEIDHSKHSDNISLTKVRCDRNGVVQIFSSEGILIKSGGQFLYPGELVRDVSYRPMLDKKIKDIALYENQFVYVDDKAILSNAWAGKLYSLHTMPDVKMFCGGEDFSFLLTNGISIQYIKDSKLLSELKSDDKLIDILFDKKRDSFWLLGEHSVSVFDAANKSLTKKFNGDALTCFALINNNNELVVGTHNGYFKINTVTGNQIGNINSRLPSTDLTVIKEINNKLWFGSANGAFMFQSNGKYKYYSSRRWIPTNNVKDICEGSNHSVLILTDNGLGEICFTPMTLFDKATYFEQQVRARHIRLGFNATISGMKNGDVTTGSLEDSDNDGLWTSMYLGAEVFRYAATKSPEALENCRESLDAMERLYTINSLKGFPSRSFERRGYEISDVHKKNSIDTSLKQEYPGNAGVQSPFEVWRHADNAEWDWKSTTSSDEAIGHIFVFGAIAELIDDPEIKNKAIRLMDALMQHIVDHEMYMIDWNGKPTLWGRWNPEYVNARPKMVGDRKITSSNITSMLQTAYHFTHKKIYKEKALELLNKYGFLENLMRPMKDISYAPADADELSKDLSDGWNHSDDEMYFLGYWGLYRYALNDTLKSKFKAAIIDHWQIERPEKEGAWDIFTAITGVQHFDLNEAVWYLQKYPMDLIDWKVKNSERKDIDFIPQNFRRQTTKEVLPPDELPTSRHNSNRFDLNGGNENGNAEYSAGDIWLLPYWMGRYLKIISEPVEKKLSSRPFATNTYQHTEKKEVVYKDVPYDQRYSIKYFFPDSSINPVKILSDRNNNIKVLAANNLFIPKAGKLLEPGMLVKDVSYRPIRDKKISGICLYKNEFVFSDEKALLSNAWAAKLFVPHDMTEIKIISAGNDFSFLISDGKQFKLIQKGKIAWSDDAPTSIIDIQFDESKNLFWLLSSNVLYSFSPTQKKLTKVFSGSDFTCFKILSDKVLIGTHNGYIEIKPPFLQTASQTFTKLPCNDITVITEIDGNIWFGSSNGAFMLKDNNKFDYYSSERWLPSNHIIDIAKGDNNSVLILTSNGFSKICDKKITLEEKADYYEEIVRQRHIRYGFYCDYTNLKKGNLATAQMGPHDSDNLWTSMYLSGELFRYLVTHNEEAKQNCIESLDAMERLFTLSGIKGLFGRCIERRGVIEFKNEIREENKHYWYPGYENVPSSWMHSADSEWDWRGSASSDQAVGQYFALTMAAQYMDDITLKKKAINLIDELTSYIVDNDLKLIDVDGKPTLWGRWSPDYVNRFPDMVGDKKLYSSNIISFLQIAFYFTHKEKYRAKANELLYKEKYLENLARSISEIGPAPATADKWSQLMSGGWNSSDDEMYFLAYWGLYPYAFNDSLKNIYKKAIRDHWNVIRPEKESLWNFCYAAITGAKQFDLKGTIWSLQRMPLDLINWSMKNSDRKDLEYIKENNFERTTSEVLPPDERPENKHNRNFFKLDDNANGSAELGGGDVYLLPYWMGRYFGMISAPVSSLQSIENIILMSKFKDINWFFIFYKR
jgi:hypothetical protein